MDSAKIRIKIGDHEFEAEGPSAIVQSQFDAFRELLSKAPLKQEQKDKSGSEQPVLNNGGAGDDAHVPIEKILRASGRIVSLTALPQSTEDAAMLIMLGHRDLRNNENVTGQEIGDGLAQSGRAVPRTDHLMSKPIASSYVLKSGVKRATRYRLTNMGLLRALSVARELIAALP